MPQPPVPLGRAWRVVRRCLLGALLGGVGCKGRLEGFGAGHGPPPEAAWAVADGWQRERFFLPPAFAPDFPLVGVEDLRFMPGFQSPDAPDHWSYCFVWWVAADPSSAGPLTPEVLASAFEVYFRGLSAAVTTDGAAGAGGDHSAVLSAVVPGVLDRLTGQVLTIDSFSTGLPITLHVEVEQRRCPHLGQAAAVVALSRQPGSDPVWAGLRAAAEAVPCD